MKSDILVSRITGAPFCVRVVTRRADESNSARIIAVSFVRMPSNNFFTTDNTSCLASPDGACAPVAGGVVESAAMTIARGSTILLIVTPFCISGRRHSGVREGSTMPAGTRFEQAPLPKAYIPRPERAPAADFRA